MKVTYSDQFPFFFDAAYAKIDYESLEKRIVEQYAETYCKLLEEGLRQIGITESNAHRVTMVHHLYLPDETHVTFDGVLVAIVKRTYIQDSLHIELQKFVSDVSSVGESNEVQ